MNTEFSSHSVLPPLDAPEAVRLRKWRMFKDGFANYGMTVGGIGIIFAILLIFFYLLYSIYPLLLPASMSRSSEFSLPAVSAGATLHLDLEEQSEMAARYTDQGKVVFFRTRDGGVVAEHPLPLPAGASITALTAGDAASGIVTLGLSNGQALVVKREYRVSYPNDVRTLTPALSYPLEQAPLLIDDKGAALKLLRAEAGSDSNTLAAVTADHRLIVVSFRKEKSFLDETETLVRSAGSLPLEAHNYTHLLMDKEQRILYLADDGGHLGQFDISNKTQPSLTQRVQLAQSGQRVTRLEMLAGGISVLVGMNDGTISQWFPTRSPNGDALLTHIRDFHSQQAGITALAAEERRKGFIAADESGRLGIYHATAHRTLRVEMLSSAPLRRIALPPRADHVLAEDADGVLHLWQIENKHPEISWEALWSKVWYENYPEPRHIWQSSSASSDFEPKFSLAPLAFGTLKAAFYAMLLAVPLAIMGGIYTAYFMSPRIRTYVKPGIEIMAALPTVILGFLAGLWLAPLAEAYLPGVFLMLLLIPPGVLGFSYLWYRLPHNRFPEDWAAILLIPVVGLLIWLSFALSQPIEQWFFNGDLKQWMSQTLGIGFDQRNALVVGLAMGVAVIPTIFSIAEDAVFSVPRHLTTGSLALGASPWQTMTRIVILTASPGIFSAVMIGMGRAVGETMIVLMATGNTPVMDFSLFQGMRTLAANIAVELPESEVASTHYRVLFLAAMVLFIFTFIVNTAAEVVRHRLRQRYSNL